MTAVKIDKILIVGLRLFLLIVSWLLLVFTFLMVLGTLLPTVPFLGLASFVMPAFASWFMFSPCLAGGAIWFLGRNTGMKLVAVLMALFAGVSAFVIAVRAANAFRSAGAEVSIFSSADLGSKPVQEDTVVQFGKYDDQTLFADVYKPKLNQVPVPIIVNIHGGAWTAGTRKETALEQRWFADRGWLVFSVDYTLSTSEKHYWNSVHGQIGCFLNWMAVHAHEFGGDTSRVILMGTSAGGNLALNVGSMVNAGALTSTCGGMPVRISSVAVLVPGVDPADVLRNDYSLIGPMLREAVPKYPGGLPTQYPDRYKAINSSTYLSRYSPPTLIFAAMHDHMVDHHSIDRYVSQANDVGVPIKIVRIPFDDHAGCAIPGSISNKGYRQVTLKWFTELGLSPASR